MPDLCPLALYKTFSSNNSCSLKDQINDITVALYKQQPSSDLWSEIPKHSFPRLVRAMIFKLSNKSKNLRKRSGLNFVIPREKGSVLPF